jgi:2-polyprenyl-3-methyl-5-hydroxy-6-metoxy-1,4-benzoquinol methylase
MNVSELEDVGECDLCHSSLQSAHGIPGLECASLVRCNSCGLVITSPRPTRAAIGKHYPADYYAHMLRPANVRQRIIDRLKIQKGRYPASGPPLARAFWKLVSPLVRGFFLYDLPYLGEGRRLLDVGCGVGGSLIWAKEHGWDVWGIEINANAAAIAQKRGLTNVRCGTIESVNYPDAFFDAITICQVLEHVYSPTEVLTECRRILSPDGYLILTLPNFDSYPRVLLNDLWNALQIPVHLYHFSEHTLSRLVDKCGFPVEVRFMARSVAVYLNARDLRSAVKTPRRTNA